MRACSFLERPETLAWRGAGSADSANLLRLTMVVRSSMTGMLPSRDPAAEPSGVDTVACRCRDRPTLLVHLVAIARPDHCFKNIFMLPGGTAHAGPDARSLPKRGRAAAAGAGQRMPDRLRQLNDHGWLDAEFDRHDPVTKFRPSAAGQITAPVAHALRKLGPKRRANYAKPAARLAMFARVAEHQDGHQTPREALAERQGRVHRN